MLAHYGSFIKLGCLLWRFATVAVSTCTIVLLQLRSLGQSLGLSAAQATVTSVRLPAASMGFVPCNHPVGTHESVCFCF